MGLRFCLLRVNVSGATPAGDHVVIESAASDDTGRPGVSIAVPGAGPGIPAAHRGRIFDPVVTTRPPGRGATFTVQLRAYEEHA